ncbi:MAG TPA: Fic family protein [Solirubrobacteraceae bacterium]|nr:Fic family protein [Solirubrobacteraceae bacterium]
MLPAVADQLRASARVGTVHYSNLIEGNELPLIEAERAARGQLSPDTRAKVELINYVRALDLINQLLDDGSLELTSEFLKELHKAATNGLGREDDPHFKPHHEGKWRDGEALVVDKITQQVMHRGCPQAEVEPRMQGMFAWLDSMLAREGEPPFVLAGVTHYGITDVHPFADGNGRVARLFQVALLMKARVLPGRMFSFERYYAEDRQAYYGALRSVRERTLNMETWLHYFLAGMAEEYERVATTIEDLSELAPGGAAQLQLTASQQRALTRLRLEGRREFTRAEYERAAGLGRTRAKGDLQTLVRHGLLQLRGHGPSTRYALPSGEQVRRVGRNGPGRPRRWTDAMIEHELRAYLDGRDDWPSPAEFRAAQRGDLYAAASRNGGISRWRRMLGR